MARPFVLLLFLLAPLLPLQGQQEESLQATAEQLLKERGEVRMVFPRPPEEMLRELSHRLSVDRVDDDSVWVYANEAGFRYFLTTRLPYRLWLPPAAGKSRLTAATLQEVTGWNLYPTYPQYDSLMHAFAAAHPAICRLDTLGYSVQGRLLLAVKISGNVTEDEDEPAFFYTSTMHGDETGGYVLMLHLIDSLLSGYGQGGQIQRLVDSLAIWINPLSNPDGTYHGGDNDITGATRYNAQSIDLNRNYPDLVKGPHPDGNDYAPENVAMMTFMKKHRFVMSANFHSGYEVVNYPWDSWNSDERIHADSAWFYNISRAYADTTHAYATAGYMTYLLNGVTNGGDWYEISGGRQDYVTGFLHGREVTIELDDTKLTPADELLSLWDYNKRSLLNYMEEAMWGLGGYVTDATTGAPVAARLEVLRHDDEYSYTFSDTTTGYFRRPLSTGTWDLQITAGGYDTLRLTGVTTHLHQLTWLRIRMTGTTGQATLQREEITVMPNPVSAGGPLYLVLPHSGRHTVILTSLTGQQIRLVNDKPLHRGRNTLRLPQGIRGLWMITVTGRDRTAVTRKIWIQ